MHNLQTWQNNCKYESGESMNSSLEKYGEWAYKTVYNTIFKTDALQFLFCGKTCC